MSPKPLATLAGGAAAMLPKPLAGGVAAAAACGTYTRVQSCRVVKHTTTVFNKRGVPIGEVKSTSTHALVFSTKSRKFRETIVRKVDSITGKATGIRETLAVSCGSPCRATNNFPQNRVLKQGDIIKGTIAYADAVKKDKVHSTATRYTWTVSKPPHVPAATTYKSIGYRCDDKIKTRSVGCVIPKFPEVMTAMKKLPGIAANIRRIQNNSPGHYGKLHSGHPLHRMMDATKQGKNRRAVCGRRIVGPRPRPGVSCDEYPFASTREGGTALSKKNRGVAWVPAWEQGKQGGYITGSHNDWRALNGEAFYVVV
ncbi:NucA/NucB deoxyribonuclease domain-containing protein (plasmid) [Streptomyces sp. NBC_01795]|uniref:NucA/NucB deoxyribonuclease domain-containing protein n=1 Tax=unclassified Streptomyces TaxID=2593676 RepID=UPI002DDA4C07|nr:MULTISPECIES: NucA/NucB deoxyribonuclease domain-containing protein [unclassified Streptomyces]WSA97571.1 NucA/NucB deoxyribonuclease domain-containing protein [Streptomyces sp. NBC_01795]WSB82181.1 NucA/NucB deoxyribonuclease domain-containing protein [Streptomyces sp. NBC_01775]WSS18152.1 NucA/NucB deoxyribonuclease domain-containing protein [Streptomyces sp. NBC_01186]